MIPKGDAIIPVSSVKVGTVLICDGGFVSNHPCGFCMDEGAEKVVKRDMDGELFVECRDGKHFLAGQENDDDTYSGFWLKEAPNV